MCTIVLFLSGCYCWWYAGTRNRVGRSRRIAVACADADAVLRLLQVQGGLEAALLAKRMLD